MKKRIFKTGIMMLLIFFASGLQCFAEDDFTPIVTINGTVVEFDVMPVVENGRTLIPVRAVSENLNYEVVWDEDNNRVKIGNGDETLELFIGKQEYFKNGVEKQMDVPAKTTKGRTLVPLRLIAEEFGCVVRWLPECNTAEIIKHETVTVTNSKELLEAIGNYKKVILADGEYNLSKVTDMESNPNIVTQNLYDGTEYIVFETTELILEGAEGGNATIVIEPRYANALSFMYSDHITIKNITAGHTVEPGHCLGGVFRFDDCSDIFIDNCHLYGCGTYGITAVSSERMNVENTEIYECTYGLVELLQSEDIFFDNCIFRDSEEFSMFSINECSNVGVYNSLIKNNESGEYSSLVSSYESEKVHFKKCEFENNIYFYFSTEDVYFENCKGNE